ncbi:MAG TPA: TlpA disulfide reductase family protein [Solirubrobacteraceae bacterium]|nr:TlpA disulfide reductase family protein [Solirubrobacteraceae bacterium]
MRKLLIAIGALAVTAAVVAGIVQTRDSDRATGEAPGALSLAEVSRPVAGAPPELAALHRRVNALVGGGAKALDAQLRALRGHPVVVNLWASWCDPCRYELPFFQRQAVKHGDRVAFLGVNSGDNAQDARKLSERFPMPYPSFEDPRQAVAGRYGAAGLPATAFYDASGELALVHQGVFANEAKLAAAIERYALGGKASAAA